MLWLPATGGATPRAAHLALDELIELALEKLAMMTSSADLVVDRILSDGIVKPVMRGGDWL